jgi:AcrR family transcriptional regulator
LPRGDNNPSRSYVVHNQRERILDAVARLAASRGYAHVTVEDITEEAAISLNAFYEHFENKDDAFVVAYEVGHAKCLAYVEAAYAAHDEWHRSVHAGIAALLEFLAIEPAFARIALVDVLTATPRTAERSSLGVSAFAQLLVAGLGEDDRKPSSVIVDAIAGGIFELCLDHAIRGRTAQLPELAPVATFLALAPFVGAEDAARVAASALRSDVA